METERPPAHGVHLYAVPDAWIDAVLGFVESGLGEGESVVLTTTAAHWSRLADGLKSCGRDPEVLQRNGRLFVYDAEESLAKVTRGSRLDEESYLAVARERLSTAFRAAPRVRWWGEIVNLLHEAGRRSDAVRIEELLEDITNDARLSVLCSYRLDPLEPHAYEGMLQDLCRTHDAVACCDNAAVRGAVDRAVSAVLGPSNGDLLRAMADVKGWAKVPAAQGVLLAVRKAAPGAFDEILARVRKEAADRG